MSDLARLETLAVQTLSQLLESLNYDFEIAATAYEESLSLMISSPQAKFLIGENGDRLDDIQYLVNRSIQCQWAEAARIRIDCDEYRARSEEKLLRKARSRAERVLETGKPLRMEPLNAYQRRLVHNAIAEIEGLATESENSEGRFKRITIRLA